MIRIIGHSFIREFYYSKNDGEIESYNLLGGAALLDKIINNRAELEPNDQRLLYREFFECEKRKNTKGEDSFSLTKRIGIKKGETRFSSGEGEHTVVWDNGYDVNDKNESILDIENENDVFWISKEIIPSITQVSKIKFLMLDADVLRKLDAMISKGSSWERTAMNLMWQLRNNPDINHLLKIDHILITFAEDGAIYIKSNAINNGTISASLVLNDGLIEGSLCRKSGGRYGDEFTVMAAAAAIQFEAVINKSEFCVRPILDSVKKFTETGYNIDSLKNYKFTILKTDENECVEDNGFKIPMQSNGNTQNPDEWQIANLGSVEEIYETAVNYILYGDDHLKGKPMLEIGKLKTVDRREIESFGNVHNIITTYAKNDIKQPLSIAIFGSPGAGKSFGVEEIAENVLSKDEMEKITFNISQFTDYTELGAAFQKVRDVCLKGKLPLVFFDEFDSNGLDGSPLGWLKYFLAPLQDGEFNDANGTHPIGKCILVFAGGTSHTFRAFRSAKSPKDIEKLTNSKGFDFISRIKASIDIAGPNPRNDEDNGGITDNAYILRRALLIRGLCMRDKRLKEAVKSNKGTYISKDIINAMLFVRYFNYGVRSIETILGMSKIDNGQWMPSGLPNSEQMGIHVIDREFTDILLIKVLENAPEGIMAKKIHELHRGNLNKSTITDNSINNVDWEDLSLHFKLSNINQARNYPEYLAKHGLKIVDIGSEGEPVDEEYYKNLVEKLAKEEHNRWMEEKIRDGWKYGKIKDVKQKTHPCIMEWEELDEYTKNKDRNPIREIPIVLAMIKKCIVKSENTISDDKIEQMAQQIHESYLKKMKAAGNTNHPSVIEWHELSEEIKEANRAQARSIEDKLKMIGLSFGKKNITFPVIEELDESTVLSLAEIEHVRWMDDKIAHGWVYAPVRDDENKHHPCLVPYEDLPVEEQNKDIDAVKNMISLLKSIGLYVYKTK